MSHKIGTLAPPHALASIPLELHWFFFFFYEQCSTPNAVGSSFTGAAAGSLVSSVALRRSGRFDSCRRGGGFLLLAFCDSKVHEFLTESRSQRHDYCLYNKYWTGGSGGNCYHCGWNQTCRLDPGSAARMGSRIRRCTSFSRASRWRRIDRSGVPPAFQRCQ